VCIFADTTPYHPYRALSRLSQALSSRVSPPLPLPSAPTRPRPPHQPSLMHSGAYTRADARTLCCAPFAVSSGFIPRVMPLSAAPPPRLCPGAPPPPRARARPPLGNTRPLAASIVCTRSWASPRRCAGAAPRTAPWRSPSPPPPLRLPMHAAARRSCAYALSLTPTACLQR
jgi:hypothetical protein